MSRLVAERRGSERHSLLFVKQELQQPIVDYRSCHSPRLGRDRELAACGRATTDNCVVVALALAKASSQRRKREPTGYVEVYPEEIPQRTVGTSAGRAWSRPLA
jgi:hypothetical protein